MTEKENIDPILKWAGGKRQLFSEIKKLLPNDLKERTYYEPFLGGGSVFFSLQPQNGVVNDINNELINLYLIVKQSPKELITELKKMENTEDEFYKIRNLDRDKDKYQNMSKIQKAARTIYLNRTSFNGLYRVNSKGQYNTPYGKYENPRILDEGRIMKMHEFLKITKVKFLSEDFEKSLNGIKKDSFVYFDPPYDPISKTAKFTSYYQNSFGESDQIRLRNLCLELNNRGVKFLLSNSNTEFVNELYADKDIFRIKTILAKRNIGAKVENRKPVYEVLITNY